MCFSATASFTSAAVLTITGTAAVMLNKGKHQRLVFLPIIFGIQQAAEGVVWITQEQIDLSSLHLKAVVTFLFITFAFWPAWIPWAVHQLEPSENRRRWLVACGVGGLLLAIAVIELLFTKQPRSEIVGQCLDYSFEKNASTFFPPNIEGILYFSSVVIPFFISSFRWVKILGGLILFGWLITQLFWKYASASVWCFFAAIASFFICVHIYREKYHHLRKL